MGSGNLPKLMYKCIRQGTTEPWPRKHYAYAIQYYGYGCILYGTTTRNTIAIRIRTIYMNSRDVSRAAYHVRKFAKIVQAFSVTAIGFKGQRNNNRGGGRRPGFEATV